MGSEHTSHKHEKSNKNETKGNYDDRFSNHSETQLANERELVSDAKQGIVHFCDLRKHVDIVEGMYQPSNIQLDSATSIMSPAAPPSIIIASRHVQNESSFTFKTVSNLQCDATVQTNVIAIQETPASSECVCDLSSKERTSHACQNVPHKGPVLLKSEHFNLQKSPSEPYESVSFSSSVVGTQMTQFSPTDPTHSHSLPLKSAFLSCKPVPPFVPFSSSVEINMASKPLHLNSTFATFQPCHGVFSSSIATQLSQFTDVPPMPPTAENMCLSKQGTALNLLEESSDLSESDSSRANNNISTCLEQLLIESLKQLIDIDVLLQLLKGEILNKKKLKILWKKMSQLSDYVKVVQRTWGDVMIMINKETPTENKSDDNIKKHQIPELGRLENCDKHNTVHNDKGRSVVHDEDTIRSYLGEHSWQIVKDKSEIGIRDNRFYCNICKTKVSGFASVVTHFYGKRHGKELNNCLTLLNNFSIVGDKGHCKLCNTEIPCTLRDMFDHINGTRHKLQENCTNLKIHAVEDVPFSASVEIKVASKPLHLNSTFATFQPCNGAFSSSTATQLSQCADVPPMPMTAENVCSSKQVTALNLLQESSDRTESVSSMANNNISACLKQLLIETLKKLIDIDVVLKLLKEENMIKNKRKILRKRMSQLSDNVKMVQRTWHDIIKITNNVALTANVTVNNNKVSVKGRLKNSDKHNTVQNDKNRSVHDEDIISSYLGEDSWQIVKDTSEVGIRYNRFFCNICKTNLHSFDIVKYFVGKSHGKELNKRLKLLNNFFTVGNGKLCTPEIPRTLRDMFETYNSQNWQQLSCNILDPLVNTDTAVHLETPARHDQLLAKLIANPSHLLTSKFVGFYCIPCNLFNYGNNVAKHAIESAHLVNMKNSEANRILFCGTCKIVLWGNINLLVQHKLSAGHIEIQHLY